MPTRRTTHRSSAGAKLYAVRDSATGKFREIQSYKKATHGQTGIARREKPRTEESIEDRCKRAARYLRQGRYDGVADIHVPSLLEKAAAEIRRLRKRIETTKLENWEKGV